MVEFKKEVEAILFSAGRAVLLNEFLALLHIREAGVVKQAVKELMEEYAERDSPIMIVEEGDGWKLTVKERFLPTVQRINPHTELSKSILETLSVIAWKHPVVQSAVIKIRTNKAYDHISELERLGFVSRERHGRSFILKVTPKFLEYFDLPDSKAIKETFKDFKDIESAVQSKVDDFEKTQAESSSEVEAAHPAAASGEGDKPAQAGADVKPYSDSLPEIKIKRKSGADLEPYNDSLDEEEASAEEEPEEDDRAHAVKISAEDLFEEDSSAQQPGADSEEERARRLAEQILAEDAAEQKAAVDGEERKLHPQLEKLISGMKKPPIPTPEPRAPKREEPKKPTVPRPAQGQKPQKRQAPVSQVEAPAAEEPVQEQSEAKVAEEFPGQFSKKPKK